MPITNNQVKVIVVGVIGVSTLLYLIFRTKKSTRYVTRNEFYKENFKELNTNFNHHDNIAPKTFNSVAIGRSDVTRSLSSRNSMLKETGSLKLANESSDDMNCGRLGLKSLDDVIASLEEATYKIDKYEMEHMFLDAQVDSHLLLSELRQLMEDAYKIRNKYKQKLIITSSSYVGSDESDDSDNDSFVSAMEYYHDDNIIDEYKEASNIHQRYLFKAALLELENGNIYYRSKRTELVRCQNDTEYLAKLHCIRIAFEYLFEDEQMTKQMEEIGDNVGAMLLLALGYESEGFQHSYKSMITFLRSNKAASIIKEELSDKGIEVLSFYDIFFDFIVFDALESLENPPSSLVSIINNRWLTEGFKKTTLNSSVWTILLAKRKFLKHKSGFKAHFYDIIDVIGAPLAWSFLGPDTKANQVAGVLKDSLQALVTFMFSDEPRFTTAEELARDISGRFLVLKETLYQELEMFFTDSSSLTNG